MNKRKEIKTPVGNIIVQPNATPSSAATTTVKEMQQEFIKVAKSGTVPVERLRNDEYQYPQTQ